MVRCEETVPANSLRRAARVLKKSTVDTGPTTAAAPAGYTCDATYHRIAAQNGLVVDATDDDEGSAVTWNGWDDDQESQYWQVCTGPDTDGVPPVVLMSLGYGTCLQPVRGATSVEGAEIGHYACEATPKAQKFHIYRDVPGSTSVGLQAAFKGAMLGSQTIEDGEALRQYEAGLPDGSGTLDLQPIT